MSNTLTRSDLAQAVHLEVGLSRNESSQLVEDVLEKMTDCFVKGEKNDNFLPKINAFIDRISPELQDAVDEYMRD